MTWWVSTSEGTLFTVQYLLPLMSDGASIILNGTTSATKGIPGTGVYSASKAAVRSLARTWAAELKDRAIRVNVISPGSIETALFRPCRPSSANRSFPPSPWDGWGPVRRSRPPRCSLPPRLQLHHRSQTWSSTGPVRPRSRLGGRQPSPSASSKLNVPALNSENEHPPMSSVSFIGLGGMTRAIAARAVEGDNAVEVIGRDHPKLDLRVLRRAAGIRTRTS